MSKLCFLGTGGAFAAKERDNTSFILDSGKKLILIDCPGSIIQKIYKLKFNPRDISSILVTHIHPDHIYGLPSFVHSLMLEGCSVNLLGSEESINFCKKLLDLFDLQEKRIKFRFNFVYLNPGHSFQLASSLSCTSLKVPHSHSSLAFHFYFEEEKKELLYSGDTPIHPPLFREAAEIDYLVHDCSAPSRFFRKYPSLHSMHTNSIELGRISQKAGIKCLIPCHFFSELDYSMSEIDREIRRNYNGKLIIPEDLTKITL